MQNIAYTLIFYIEDSCTYHSFGSDSAVSLWFKHKNPDKLSEL